MKKMKKTLYAFTFVASLAFIGIVPPTASAACDTQAVCDFVHCFWGCAYYTYCGGPPIITCVNPSLCGGCS